MGADKNMTADALRILSDLEKLDATTKVPFIVIELTGEGEGIGEIEICGKDEYGVYDALHRYFTEDLEFNEDPDNRCTKMEPTEGEVPFCKAQYRWPGFHVGEDDMTNMGLTTMKITDFMCGQ